MADWNVTPPSEAFGLQFDRMAGQIRCAMPGVIQSFDPESQTAEVLPAIPMKVNLGDGVKQLQLPVIKNVPMVLPFAQGAGMLLTLPIKPDDECLLIFSDRAIDNFVRSGGVQPTVTTENEDTTAPRCHHLSDAIFIPGCISNPQAVPEYNTENIELRDRERKHYISIGTDPEGITITDGTATWNMNKGMVTLNAPNGIRETSESDVSRVTSACHELVGVNIDVGCGRTNFMDGPFDIGRTGAENIIRGATTTAVDGTYIDEDGVNLNTHLHTGVQPGPGDTGEPQK